MYLFIRFRRTDRGCRGTQQHAGQAGPAIGTPRTFPCSRCAPGAHRGAAGPEPAPGLLLSASALSWKLLPSSSGYRAAVFQLVASTRNPPEEAVCSRSLKCILGHRAPSRHAALLPSAISASLQPFIFLASCELGDSLTLLVHSLCSYAEGITGE